MYEGEYMMMSHLFWVTLATAANDGVDRRVRGLRVVAYDMRGPRFTEICSMVEIPFVIAK